MIKHQSDLALRLAAFNLKAMRLVWDHHDQRLSTWYLATLFILPYFFLSQISLYSASLKTAIGNILREIEYRK